MHNIAKNQVNTMQKIKELLKNAIRFQHTLTPVVEIFFTQEQQHFLITVKDRGTGMTKKDTQRIFWPYETLSHPLSGNRCVLFYCHEIIKRI